MQHRHIRRSESPSQVFFILLHWLTSLSPSDEPLERTLAYDNMCNLDHLRVACKPLPLPPPLDQAWLDLEKIIDKFHFPNHTSQKCKELYSPEKFKAAHPTYNTQAGEQTFIGLDAIKALSTQWPRLAIYFTYIQWLWRGIGTLRNATRQDVDPSYLRRVEITENTMQQSYSTQ